GGQRTKDEMCSHTFTYYPRINNLFLCASMQSFSAWQTVIDNSSSNFDREKFNEWLRNIKWTDELKIKWQEFYNKGSRRIILGGGNQFDTDLEYTIPTYEDFKSEECHRSNISEFIHDTTNHFNSTNSPQKIFFILLFIQFIIGQIFNP
ncbi:unnamed protein product, partial [Rotaria sp. Silwood1]